MSLAPTRVISNVDLAKHIGITAGGADKLERSALTKLRRSPTMIEPDAERRGNSLCIAWERREEK
jgi:hypothetical protein